MPEVVNVGADIRYCGHMELLTDFVSTCPIDYFGIPTVNMRMILVREHGIVIRVTLVWREITVKSIQMLS